MAVKTVGFGYNMSCIKTLVYLFAFEALSLMVY